MAWPAPESRWHTAGTPAAPQTMPNPPSSPLLLQLFRLQEADRRHVGRALHNQVGQALSAIKMAAHLVQSEDDPAQRQEDLQEIIRASDETVALLRELHATLHPPQLDAIGLDAALRAEHERLFPAQAASRALAPLPQAPAADTALVAFRIVQAIARAVAREDGVLALSLDGDAGRAGGLVVGMEAEAAVDVAGLDLLQALAEAVDGRLEAPGGGPGMRWRLRLPYAPASPMPADPA